MTTLIKAFLGEFARLRANAAAFSTMVVAVVVYGLFYPQPYLNEAIKDVPVMVVDQDHSTTSRDLIRRIDAGEGAAVVATAPDMQAARDAFFARDVSAIVVIPAGFERDLLAGRQSPIAAFGDGGYFLLYRQAIGAISAAAQSIGVAVESTRLVAAGTNPNTAMALVDPLRSTLIPLFNPQGGYASYVVPAAFVLLLQQTLLMGVGLLRAGRREGEPGLPALFGQALAYVALYVLWMVFYLVLLPWAYHLPRLGSVFDMLLLGLPFLLSTSLLGMTLANLLPSREGVVLLLVGLGMPLFFLSGASWPAEALPPAVDAVAQLIPSSSAIRGLVRIDQMGAGLAEVRREWLTLMALCLLYGVTAVVTRRRGAD